VEHPFEVGKTYRNRKGEYEVVSLDNDDMVIRYEKDGTLLETSVEIQARIWRNIRWDREARRRRRETARSRRRRRRGAQFTGLKATDFQDGVRGTSWRARTGLGGLLARKMSEKTRHEFQSYAVPRRPEAHVVRIQYYDRSTSERNAKFQIALDENVAQYGFYVEKGQDPADENWDWGRFIAAIDQDEALQDEIEEFMWQLALRWLIPGLSAQVEAASEGLIWKSEEDDPQTITWSDFVERLGTIEPGQQSNNLYLYAQMDKDQAIEAQLDIASPVVEVFQALLPLYNASVQKSG
jgi:hypothetical protein